MLNIGNINHAVVNVVALKRLPLYIFLFLIVVRLFALSSTSEQIELPVPADLPTEAEERAGVDSMLRDVKQAIGLPVSDAPILTPVPAYQIVTDSVGTIDSVYVPKDSIEPAGLEINLGSFPGDSVMPDSLAPDTIPVAGKERPKMGKYTGPSRMRKQKVDLDNVVNMQCADSMIMIGRNLSYMYGNGQVTYGQLKLNAAEIEMNMRDNTVYAFGAEDSTGEIIGKPVFEDNGTQYETQDMSYNFKTKRGFINNVITQQGEGYLTGGQTKKTDDDYYYIQNGRYTTCDDHECPHFYFQLTKAKVKPKSNIVTGPAYLVVAGLPLPLAVPFGYFPFSEKYSSGIIFPTFGEDYNRGFYLSDGGYYFAINDNIDLALTGEIYTKGSWGISGQSTYVKRYKFSGNFNFNYLTTITGDKGMADYSKMTNFQVLWSHSQDAKANPNMTFSASVNFTTSGYSRNALNSYYSSSFTENTKSSSINMTYRFPQSKWSLSTTMNLSQRSQDSTLSVSFPNVTVTMSQVYPFKRKKAVGNEKWYEKIRLSYSGQLQNSLTAKQDVFFQKSLIKDWRNAMKHNVPISATFNILKYFNITPSINLTDRMYTSKVERMWDPNAAAEIADTVYGFYNVWDFNASVSLDTKVYGFFQPLPFLGDKVKMIRHVLTPTISFSGHPNFGAGWFGYYGSYQYPNAAGEMQTRTYSKFQNALFGVPGSGRSGSMSISLSNNVEMKVKTNDSIGEKKISLIENLSISESYNFAADSMNWSNLNTNLLLRLTKSFNLNLNAVWDVYTYQLNSSGNPVRVNVPRWKAGKGLARLSSVGTSFSYTFNNDTFRKKSSTDSNKNNSTTDDNFDTDVDTGPVGKRRRPGENEGEGSNSDLDADGYAHWSFPWSLSVNYSISYGYGTFNKQKMEYDGKITQNLSFSGSIRPTPNWNFSFSASYNFETKKLAYMNCNISRDLHCFTMTASIIPVGPYKSYNFHIAIKSSLLSDVKYDKRSSTSNGVKWY